MKFAAFLLPAGAGSLDYCAGCCLPRPDGVRRARWTGEMGATGRDFPAKAWLMAF